MEYKQRLMLPPAVSSHLPGWILTDRVRGWYHAVLNPDFIRSFSCELDPVLSLFDGLLPGELFPFRTYRQ